MIRVIKTDKIIMDVWCLEVLCILLYSVCYVNITKVYLLWLYERVTLRNVLLFSSRGDQNQLFRLRISHDTAGQPWYYFKGR